MAQGYDTFAVHPDEVVVSEQDVRRLLRAQLPQWADLPLFGVARSGTDNHAGTDNAVFRLGSDLSVRLPRIGWAVDQVAHDHTWLPLLAPFLPCAVPEPLALGEPDDRYPFPWAVHRWLPGRTPDRSSQALAEDLAAFVTALHAVDPDGARPSSRGGPLLPRDDAVQESIAALGDQVDATAVRREWSRALAAAPWAGAPVWVHGDLTEGNVLVDGDRLAGVIDFGATGVGDPAIDLHPAWTLLDPPDREVFRVGVGCDDDTWVRGRGWALSVALIAWPYYRTSNPPMVVRCRRMIDALLTA